MTAKQLARSFVGAGCRGSLLLRSAEKRLHGRLTILCYHRVLPSEARSGYPFPDLVVTPDAFRRQCRLVGRHYQVLPLRDAVAALKAGDVGARPLAAITFDDGYQDNFRFAAPILAEVGLRATFFVISDLVGTMSAPWYDQMARAIVAIGPAGVNGHGAREPQRTRQEALFAVAMAKRLRPEQRAAELRRLWEQAGGNPAGTDELIMDWNQLRALASEGHEVASHSANHEILTQLDDVVLNREIGGSRIRLEEGLGQPVRCFCYPNGDFDERVVRAVRAAGYTCAVGMAPGVNGPNGDPFRLKRWFIHQERLAGVYGRFSPTLLRMEISSLADRAFGRRRSAMPSL